MSKYSDYIVFVDESGDHGLENLQDNHYPVFVLACCIFKKSDYIHKITPQVRQLKFDIFGHDRVILHESEIVKRKGAFSNLSKQIREDLILELTSIIETNNFHIVAWDVDKKRHVKEYGKTSNLYYHSFESCLIQIYDLLTELGQIGITHIVCESRGKEEDPSLELEFRRICDGKNIRKIQLPFDLIILPKIANSEGLQLVDLVARPIGLNLLRPEQPNRAYEIIAQKRISPSTKDLNNQQLGQFVWVEPNQLSLFDYDPEKAEGPTRSPVSPTPTK